MLNIMRDTDEFLSVLVRIMGARRILEIGTSNGYSTLWLADAARSVGGTVMTVEMFRLKIDMAQANFARSDREISRFSARKLLFFWSGDHAGRTRLSLPALMRSTTTDVTCNEFLCRVVPPFFHFGR
jgi:hypothetical protein